MFSAMSRRMRVSWTTSSPSLGRGRGRRLGRGGGLGRRGEVLHVLLGDAAADARAVDLREVDLQLRGEHLHRGRVAVLAALELFGRLAQPDRLLPARELGASARRGAGMAAGAGAGPRARPRRALRVGSRRRRGGSRWLWRPLGGRGGRRCGSRASPSPPTSTTAISAPAWTVWPSFARISRRMPVTGAGTSALTLSVSTSSIGSNSTTLSPGLTSHLAMVPSCTDSPSCGMTTRVVLPAIRTPPAREARSRSSPGWA